MPRWSACSLTYLFIHEAFREIIIEMPPTPISWDYSLLANCEEFFEWIEADLRPTAKVDERLRGLPGEIRLPLTEEGGYTMLSPAGEAFCEAYRDRVAHAQLEPILLSAQAWDTYRNAAPDIRQLFDRALKKPGLRELRLSGSDCVRNCDCLVYPKGHRDERLFFFEGQDGSVRVCDWRGIATRVTSGSYNETFDLANTRTFSRGPKGMLEYDPPQPLPPPHPSPP